MVQLIEPWTLKDPEVMCALPASDCVGFQANSFCGAFVYSAITKQVVISLQKSTTFH